MELLCRVSRGKIGETDTGKRDYRHHARKGYVDSRRLSTGGKESAENVTWDKIAYIVFEDVGSHYSLGISVTH